jgi:hypothetical protein
MKSPNGQYEIIMENYGEIRMGSPAYGRIKILGASFDTSNMEFGVPMAFSPDSRFLAVEQLVSSSSGPDIRVVVFDFEQRDQSFVHAQNPGIVRRFSWSAKGLLRFVIWSHQQGEQEHYWQAPEAKPASSLKKIFGLLKHRLWQN